MRSTDAIGADAPDLRLHAAASLAEWRIGICYLWRHRRLLQLKNARRFTELVQLRKLQDRCPSLSKRLDKLAAKHMAQDILGREWIVPTLWSGTSLPATCPFRAPAMLKARHGCNQNAVIDRPPDRAGWWRRREAAQRWMSRPYGRWLDEWAYRDVPRGLLAEPLLGGRLPLPVDYKVYVFGGCATHIQVHLDRGARHRWVLHDRNWHVLGTAFERPPPPASLQAMLSAAEALAIDVSFLRVDFYEIDGCAKFGEFCVYPGSGLDPFAEDWIDIELGRLWLAALAAPVSRRAGAAGIGPGWPVAQG